MIELRKIGEPFYVGDQPVNKWVVEVDGMATGLVVFKETKQEAEWHLVETAKDKLKKEALIVDLNNKVKKLVGALQHVNAVIEEMKK